MPANPIDFTSAVSYNDRLVLFQTHRFIKTLPLKALFHPACLARVVSWFAFVVAIFMAHENGDKQRETKSRHVQGMLDETEPLIISQFNSSPEHRFALSCTDHLLFQVVWNTG